MAGHSHWRVWCTSDHYPALEECEYYDIDGDYLSAGGSASASDQVLPWQPAAGAFDRILDPGDFHWWGPPGPIPNLDDQWLAYSFPSDADVACVRLVEREVSGGEAPSSVRFQYSDNGSDWTDATPTMAARFGNQATNHNNAWSFAIGTVPTGKYCNWRVRPVVAANGGGALVDCSKLEFHETVGGPDITDSTPQYAIGDATALYAFDGDSSTNAEINAPGDGTFDANNWLGFAFTHPVQIQEVCWTMPISGSVFSTKGPVQIALEGSNDGGVTWTSVQVLTFGAWTADGQKQCLSLSSLSIICGDPPNGVVGVDYSFSGFPVQGGTPPYTFSIVAGSLPTGLTLNSLTGAVSGLPNTPGTFTFTVQVTDSQPGSGSGLPGSFTNAVSVTLVHGLGSLSLSPGVWDSAGNIIKYKTFQEIDGDTVTLTFVTAQTGRLILTPAAWQQGFVSQTSVTVTHNLASLNIIPVVYDGSNNVIEFQSFQLIDENTAVVTFKNSQTGNVIIISPLSSYSQSFTGVGTGGVTVAHNLGLLALRAVAYNESGYLIDFNSFGPLDPNHSLLTFATPQTGRVVVITP